MLEKIFISVIITSLVGTLLAVILWLLKPITRRTFSAAWNYYIWVCVLAVTVIPVRITLPAAEATNHPQAEITIPQRFESAETVPLPSVTPPSNEDIHVDIDIPNVTDTKVIAENMFVTEAAKVRELLPTVSVVWIIIASAVFVLKLVRYIVFILHIRRTSYSVEIPQIKSGHVSAKINSRIASPLMTGVFKPVLLLPDTTLTDEQLDNIVLHEMTHFKRRDMLVKWFSVIVKSIHFFNPAIYFICRQLDEECEISCDAVVVKDMTRERELSYVNTIIALLSETHSRQIPLTTGMAGSKKALKKRFLLIKNKKSISKKAVFISVAVAIVLVITAIILGGILNGNIIEDENNTTNLLEIAINEPIDLETDSGVGVEIAFENEDMLIFYGNFGLFGYDLKANEIEFSVDFVKAVGIEGSVQGSYGTAVDVSEDGNTIIISEYTVETESRGKTCYIDVPSLTYKYREYKPLENPFNKDNVKGSIYPGIKISQMKYTVNGKEWSLFETENINTDLNLTDSNSSSFRTRYVFEFYGMLDFVAELVDKEVLSNWMKQFENGERSIWELTLFTAVCELNIPVEALSEANIQSGSIFTDEQIAALYSRDIKKVNECFVNPYALLHNGEIYTADWLATHTVDDYKRTGITVDELKEYLNKINIYELNFAYIPIAINANSMNGFNEKITTVTTDIGVYIVFANGKDIKARCKEYGKEYTVWLDFEPDHAPEENAFYWVRGTYDFTSNLLTVPSSENFHCPQRYEHTD